MDHGISRRQALIGAGGLALGGCAGLHAAEPALTDQGRIEYVLRGSGPGAVVLMHGLGIGIKTWSHVIDPIAEGGQVFAYNRAGYGASAWRNEGRTAGPIVAEVRAALADAGLAPPFVLVGHSLGGLYAQAMARTFPQEVSGLVLVDSVVPGQTQMFKRMVAMHGLLVGIGTLRMTEAARREFADSEATEAEVAAAPPYRAGPVKVLRALNLGWTVDAAYADARRAAMAELASAYCGEVIDASCGHFIQDERPELVINAVRGVLES